MSVRRMCSSLGCLLMIHLRIVAGLTSHMRARSSSEIPLRLACLTASCSSAPLTFAAWRAWSWHRLCLLAWWSASLRSRWALATSWISGLAGSTHRRLALAVSGLWSQYETLLTLASSYLLRSVGSAGSRWSPTRECRVLGLGSHWKDPP